MLLFALTIFLSASLLFVVQPMAGKYLLPSFGGTPSVWTACLLFFQTVLLAGYAYAHALTRLRVRMQAAIHTAVAAAAVAAVAYSWVRWRTPLMPAIGDTAARDPLWMVVGALAVGVGLPYFVLSTTGPLVQAWFARAVPGRSPYRLYALSNAGSLLALLAYPVAIEPLLGLRPQARLWGVAFALFGVMAVACGWRAAGSSESQAHQADTSNRSVRATPLRFLMWMVLAACASTLLLAVTNQISQDVAVVPFLWVLPLALYLVTFILCFEYERVYRRGAWIGILAVALIAVCWTLFQSLLPIAIQLLVYCGFLFAGCMICHGELVRSKPATRSLTAFYLALSAGGVAGGIFVGLFAPMLFVGYWEFPIAIWMTAAIAAAAWLFETDSLLRRSPALAYPLIALVALGIPALTIVVKAPSRVLESRYPVLALAVVVLFALRAALTRRVSRWMPAALLLILLVSLGATLLVHRTVRTRFAVALSRNFYGTLAVVEDRGEAPEVSRRYMRHGTILHGAQYLIPERQMEPTTYYSSGSGIGLAVRRHPRRPEPLRIGVAGLGTGTVAALTSKGDTVRFYEINPAVIALTIGERPMFTFLRDTEASVETVLGDARKSLEAERKNGSQQFDILALDAFSGDAIPLHLLTREAMALYLSHLRDERSILGLHITNQHLDLRGVVYRLAREFGLHVAWIHSDPIGWGLNKSDWMLLSRDPAFFAVEEVVHATKHPVNLGEAPLWTDDYTNLLSVVKWRKK